MWEDILKRLYETGKINEERLITAVTKGLITQQEKDEIVLSN